MGLLHIEQLEVQQSLTEEFEIYLFQCFIKSLTLASPELSTIDEGTLG